MSDLKEIYEKEKKCKTCEDRGCEFVMNWDKICYSEWLERKLNISLETIELLNQTIKMMNENTEIKF
jgi:hypothetical protein